MTSMSQSAAYGTPPQSGASRTVLDPATGEQVGAVRDFDAAETVQAIEAAHRAFAAWSRTTAQHRAMILKRWAVLMLERADDIARILTREQGKPLVEAEGEVRYAASFAEWFGEEARRVNGEVIPSPRTDGRIMTIRRPVGVVAAITPWNFPAAMITRKIAPALAAGCTAVVKPSELTPLTAEAIIALAYEAGVPKDVLQLVTGDPFVIGPVLTGHRLVRKLSFTGSTRVGKLLAEQSAGTMKRLSMELGGNAPFIVFDDADLDAAIEGLMASKFRNSGQTCVCANRILVQSGIYCSFAARLAERVAGLRVGPGLDAGTEQGPLINDAALRKVESLVQDAVAKGASVLAGGERHALGRTFFEPTVLSGATPVMAVAREEIFGPVAALFPFDTEEEAVAIANATDAGLAAYVYSRDLNRFWRLTDALEVGMIGFNTGLISTEVAPFGGVKDSGLGREGSSHGIEEYLDIRMVALGGVN